VADLFTVTTVVAGSVTAATIDVITRRVPNALTIGLAAIGLVGAASGVGGLSVATAALGFITGFVLMLPGHFLGGTGAGDVKLMAALGAIIGPQLVLMGFFYTALAGGALALGFALARRQLRGTLKRTGRLVTSPAAARNDIANDTTRSTFPYAPAVAAGAIAAVLIHG
jgi:prepilin peptidase CpaA